MTERPIIFSGAMVCAILQGRKQQTRRALRDQQPIDLGASAHGAHLNRRQVHDHGRLVGHRLAPVLCPYGAPGDRLWVRETHAGDNLCGWVYRADHPTADIRAGELDDGEQSLRRWTPAIHMKREACRLRLEVTGVRIEHLQDISNDDAKAEGVHGTDWGHGMDYGGDASYVPVYRELWDSLNAKRGFGWAANPWVWVLEFRRS